MEFLGPLPASPLAALLFLAFLPLWPWVQGRHARLFFTTLSIVMILLVTGPVVGGGLLAVILLAYFPIEWAAGLRRGRGLALLAGWLALHAAAYACLYLPLPPAFRDERLLRPDHAQWMFVMVTGIGLTFLRLVSHLFDRLSGRVARVPYADYLCYMVYFPQFRCVPVERGRGFIPKLKRARANWAPRDVAAGLARIALGLVALAAVPRLAKALPQVFDVLNPTAADNVFSHPERLPTWQLVVLVHAIPAAIYGLVSGTASVQLGLSRAFGVRGSENTRYPFLATSPRTLWQRWNITVFAWLRDYAYAPLGGGRRRLLNILLVFIYCGLLHALHWRGALWGLWSGIGVAAVAWAADRRRTRRRDRASQNPEPGDKPPTAAWPPGRLRRWFWTPGLRGLAALATIEWATVGAVILVDADHAGARLLREYFTRLAMAVVDVLR